MGLDQTVTFSSGTVPEWAAVSALLAQRGFAVQLRMIDGQLAFPDEQPSADWHELRVGTAQGMVTLRRGPDHVICVTWGNADAPLRQAWNALAWAFAAVGDGQVAGSDQARAADEFLAMFCLPFQGNVAHGRPHPRVAATRQPWAMFCLPFQGN